MCIYLFSEWVLTYIYVYIRIGVYILYIYNHNGAGLLLCIYKLLKIIECVYKHTNVYILNYGLNCKIFNTITNMNKCFLHYIYTIDTITRIHTAIYTPQL